MPDLSLLASIEIPVAWIVVPLLLAVILYDLRFMRIPNALVVLFGAVALASVPFQIGLEELLWRLGIAAVVFCGGLILYARRMMGAGDVKLLSTLMLLIPVEGVQAFSMMLSLSILVGVGTWMLVRQIRAGRPTRWRSLQKQGRFPLGLSIGSAGLVFVLFGPEALRGMI
ncbi:A24 family peptidase [Sulfitobacter sp. JB4-11]|uniref:A24 family peptidase n=1 Tax=Sulfitobacter rhodophyticola TaxID=3238304 RepID=UPI0035112511